MISKITKNGTGAPDPYRQEARKSVDALRRRLETDALVPRVLFPKAPVELRTGRGPAVTSIPSAQREVAVKGKPAVVPAEPKPKAEPAEKVGPSKPLSYDDILLGLRGRTRFVVAPEEEKV